MNFSRTITLTRIFLLFITGISLISIIGCTPRINEFPGRQIAPYALSIQFPEKEKDAGTVSADPGETITLPVNIRSLVDIPIAVRVISAGDMMVCSKLVTLHGNDEYITLQPSENITLNISFIVSGNATQGFYQTAIRCELKEPVPDRPVSALAFRVCVN